MPPPRQEYLEASDGKKETPPDQAGRLHTRQCHATPPPPARSVPWRHPPPARRARALYRGDPRGLHRTRPATRTATARSLPRSPRVACLSPARARRDMRAPRPRLAFSMCRVKAQGGRCRVAEPSARPVAVARFSLDTVMIALPSGSSCSCLCGQLNNSGSRSLRVPNPDPNPTQPHRRLVNPRGLVGWRRRQGACGAGGQGARAGGLRPRHKHTARSRSRGASCRLEMPSGSQLKGAARPED